MEKANTGLFVGLITIDFIYLTASIPEKNQKIVAIKDAIAAGGPATNAATTFSYLGNNATLMGVVGNHPLGHLIFTDLEPHGVKICDLDPSRSACPPVSSIIVTQATGDRAVISINAVNCQATPPRLSAATLQDISIVLLDGHQMAASYAIAQQAKERNIPVVADGGSWKPGFEKVLPLVDYAICSANFYPPNCQNQKDVFAYLESAGITHIAITRGEKPIDYLVRGNPGRIEVNRIQAVDTLGAGDIFHGAFCHFILQRPFIDSLEAAAAIASGSCQFFGTRQWMGAG